MDLGLSSEVGEVLWDGPLTWAVCEISSVKTELSCWVPTYCQRVRELVDWKAETPAFTELFKEIPAGNSRHVNRALPVWMLSIRTCSCATWGAMDSSPAGSTYPQAIVIVWFMNLIHSIILVTMRFGQELNQILGLSSMLTLWVNLIWLLSILLWNHNCGKIQGHELRSYFFCMTGILIVVRSFNEICSSFKSVAVKCWKDQLGVPT